MSEHEIFEEDLAIVMDDVKFEVIDFLGGGLEDLRESVII